MIELAQIFKSELQAMYGDEFLRLIVFGSYARAENQEDSDIDFAVVMRNPQLKASSAIFEISPLSTRLGLEYERVISVFPVSDERLKSSNQAIFQEIRKDGITI